jgi:aminoglycoside phosphotransferase (APT) family kinase protein
MPRNLESIRESLINYLPGGPQISQVTPLSTGHSNETYLLEGLGHILRLPPVSEPLLDTHSHGVFQQALIYERLGRIGTALPVPKILHSCSDETVLGDPFFVMERAPGEVLNDYVLPAWFTEATVLTRDNICRQWVETFAALTNLAPVLEIGSPVRPEEEVHRWQQVAASANSLALVAVLDRLLDVPARRSGAAVPVHGDPKLANLLWEEGQLTAVLDWELAYNGEPLSDLGYILHFFASDTHGASPANELPGMWSRAAVIDAWEGISSRSARGVEWYEIAADAKMAAILAYGFHLYETGRSSDARFIRWNQTSGRMTQELERTLQDLDAFRRKVNR